MPPLGDLPVVLACTPRAWGCARQARGRAARPSLLAAVLVGAAGAAAAATGEALQATHAAAATFGELRAAIDAGAEHVAIVSDILDWDTQLSIRHSVVLAGECSHLRAGGECVLRPPALVGRVRHRALKLFEEIFGYDFDEEASEEERALAGAEVHLQRLRLEEFAQDSKAGGGGLWGGAVVVYAGGRARFENVSFVGNEAPRGGGGAVYGKLPGALEFVGCVFESNKAKHRGGAVGASQRKDVTFRDCSFVANEAGFPGGGAVSISWEDPRVTFEGCAFEGNLALGDGAQGVADDLYFEPTHPEAVRNLGGHTYRAAAGRVGRDEEGKNPRKKKKAKKMAKYKREPSRANVGGPGAATWHAWGAVADAQATCAAGAMGESACAVAGGTGTAAGCEWHGGSCRVASLLARDNVEAPPPPTDCAARSSKRKKCLRDGCAFRTPKFKDSGGKKRNAKLCLPSARTHAPTCAAFGARGADACTSALGGGVCEPLCVPVGADCLVG